MNEETKSGQIFDLPTLKRLYKFVKPYQKQFFLLIGVIIVSAVLSPLLPLLIKYTVDGPIAERNLGGLLTMMALMVATLVLRGIVQFSNTYLSGWLGQNVIMDVRMQVYEKIISLRLKYFDNTPVGRLVTRTISDVETLSDVFSEGMAAIVGDILQLILIIGVMFYTDWKLSLVSLSMIPLMLFSTYVFKEKIKDSFNEVRAAVANLNTFVQEHISGMNIVQIFSNEDQEYRKFVDINTKHRKAHIRSILYYSVYYPVADVISSAGIGLIVWYGANQIMDLQMSFGTVLAFVMFNNLFFMPIRQLADRFNTLQMGIVSTDRILKILDTDEITPNTGTHIPGKVEGSVAFENVWFAYNDEQYVLKNINFSARSGETVALVGATGAGKSSVINILSRFYDINKGEIRIDDLPIKTYDLDALRRSIGIVLQDVFLFSDTIENNIRMGDQSITHDQIVEAAKLVGVHDFIERLPGGYTYNVRERGSSLSVGQRQLISFVRAMVHDPKILVLDEATSSVDSETETLIQQAIEKLMKGRTALVIAHRLSTIQEADKILVFDKGEIVESGSHAELLEKGGVYAELHKMQYKEVEKVNLD
ncbi:ABC transporter ATP-binding protein [Ravibacter arvi]|uniref:ABC transporter ATP-binding protein n=1 Tax=Ravibacter arvi TaxID=2051041 RepID=A0ABP8M4V7_9BACT